MAYRSEPLVLCIAGACALWACGADEGGSGGTAATETSTGDDGDDDGDDGDDDGDGGGSTMSSGNADTTSADGSDSSSDSGVTGGPAGSCGMGGGKGEILQITLGSPERWYLIGAPDTDEPLPLVVAFHGDEGDPFMSTRFIWGSYWEQGNLPFVVVMTKCPGCTSWYQGNTDANADYVWEVLADVAANHNVDVSRIYAVGYSGGSEFLGLHGFEFQDVFAGIQWTCGGGAWGPYTPPSRDDCKVRGRIVIAADDFLWDGAQQLRQRLENEGHEHEFIEAQCSGHCCDTPDHNEGAWAWFQTVTKCGGEVPGMCAELDELPPLQDAGPGPQVHRSSDGAQRLAPPPVRWAEPAAGSQEPDFDLAVQRFDHELAELEAIVTEQATFSDHQRRAAFRRAMAAYDTMLAAAHTRGPHAKVALQARYPRLRAAMKQIAP